MATFAQRLKILRKEKHLSQASLAEKLGISQQAVGKWETTKSQPDPTTLQILADMFSVSVDYLLGRDNSTQALPFLGTCGADWSSPQQQGVMIPVLGTVRAGYGAFAFEEDYGSEPANVKNGDQYFYLIVRGDSMEPRIHEGDLALVHRQQDVESGDLAVVLVDGEEGTLKRVIKKEGALILQPFNQAYQTQVFIGADLEQVRILGKVVETKAKW